MNTYFSEQEINKKIGKLIITIREFSGVPVGTIGKVVHGWKYGENKSGVDIEWQFIHTNRPKLVDGFSKDEYEKFLIELE